MIIKLEDNTEEKELAYTQYIQITLFIKKEINKKPKKRKEKHKLQGKDKI